LGDALAPLLLEERFADAALALCVAVLAPLSFWHLNTFDVGEEVPAADVHVALIEPLTSLLARFSVAGGLDEAASTKRAERALRALVDIAGAESLRGGDGLQDGLVQTRHFRLEASLLALVRRTPTDEHDCLAGAAAFLLCELGLWREDVGDGECSRFAVLAAVVAALPAAGCLAPVRTFGGFAYGRASSVHFLTAYVMHRMLSAACRKLSSGLRTSSPFEPSDVAHELLLAHPGALAGLARTRELALTSMPSYGHYENAALLPAPDALCRAALLNPELCLSSLLQPYRKASLAATRTRVVEVCTDAVSLLLLRHPPPTRRLEAAAAVALLAAHSAAVAALLPLGGRLETLARAYVHACRAQPWQDAGLSWLARGTARRRRGRRTAPRCWCCCCGRGRG
jgi:hypothetical protein